MNSQQKSSFVAFLSALIPSAASWWLYARLIGWLLLVYIIDIYVEHYVGSVFLRIIVNLSVVYLTFRIGYDTIARAINFLYRKKNGRQDSYVDSFILGITQLFRVLFIFTFLLFVIDVFVPLKSFIGSLTIAMALIALALRDLVTNFFNGLIIMFSSPFQLGEYIRVGDLKGKIRDMTLMYVSLQTESKDVVFVPNNNIVSKEVINYSKNKVKKVLVRLVVDKNLFARYDEFRTYLQTEMHARFSDHIPMNGVVVHVDGFERDAVVWTVEYEVSRYNFELETELKDYTATIVIAFIKQ